MKIGPTEILVILIIISLVIGATRFLPARQRQAEPAKVRYLTPTEARDEEILRSRRSSGKLIGIVLVAIGALLIITAPSLIRYFFMSYIGGALIIVIGLASLFFMSRRS
jgi:hypothetical protein